MKKIERVKKLRVKTECSRCGAMITEATAHRIGNTDMWVITLKCPRCWTEFVVVNMPYEEAIKRFPYHKRISKIEILGEVKDDA